MFLKYLRIENNDGLIRHIKFHAGLNLIVDETPSEEKNLTGNNVGKTTVLMLIDFCLGASPKGIYTDPENKKNEDLNVKNFLINTEVLVTLTLTSDLNALYAEEIIIERNFLAKKKLVRRINGQQKTEDEFEAYLTNQLFPEHYGKKPTFGQIISHNIRYKEIGVTNTLKTLNAYTRDDEYETLYLFLLGCDFNSGDTKQELFSRIRIETNFKARLESKQTRSAYEASLSILIKEIDVLNQRRASFQINQNFELDLKRLDDVRYQINLTRSQISRLRLRNNLITEATHDVRANSFAVDLNELKNLYGEVLSHLGDITKSFEDLVAFHNKMIEEKVRYISKDVPKLSAEIATRSEELNRLLDEEKSITERLSKSGSFKELEEIILSLNEKHQKRGEFETIIEQISAVERNLKTLHEDLDKIDGFLFSGEFEAKIQEKLNKFNEFFSAVSDELYSEKYALKFDPVTTKTGQRVYKFSAFNTNFSSGKKQGEITCFDIAYTLFADDQKIPCYHFLLNDKKELMHDNQLAKIARLVNDKDRHIQFVASILRDKLPPELNKEEFFIVRLSQNEKLFKIEQKIAQ
ncbi:DUF2326 domain-containing protein [Azohydromonas lata]|uniref:DUF2326 domain-containing protein n=1 Tax=Azohydromonas lata TaxID=45677 RepID=UPI000A0277E0|nr:DUF2326 domain-containing protein [Azohydromonas lata]